MSSRSELNMQRPATPKLTPEQIYERELNALTPEQRAQHVHMHYKPQPTPSSAPALSLHHVAIFVALAVAAYGGWRAYKHFTATVAEPSVAEAAVTLTESWPTK